MIPWWKQSAAVHKLKFSFLTESVEFLHIHGTCKPGVNSSIHAELYSTLMHAHTQTHMHLTLIDTYNHIHTRKVSHTGSLRIQNIPFSSSSGTSP